MSDLKPQATLQRNLLLALADAPMPSAKALARNVGASRPSVSRALSALLELGLVERVGTRGWAATASGRRQIGEAAREMGATSQRVQRQLARQLSMARQVGADAHYLASFQRLLDSSSTLRLAQSLSIASAQYDALSRVAAQPLIEATAPAHKSSRCHRCRGRLDRHTDGIVVCRSEVAVRSAGAANQMDHAGA